VYHPALVLAARAKVREQLRARGHSFVEALHLANQVDAGTLAAAASVAPPEVGLKLGTLGDGSILQSILDFLQSDLGRALVQIVLSLLLAA
jgi:hypothetical protein